MGNMSCRDTQAGNVRGQRHAEDTALIRHIMYLCGLVSSQQLDGALTNQSPAAGLCQYYLEDFCLAGVGVCVLLPGLLGVMLVLPLGPDLTGTTLELGSTLTAFP